MLVTISYLLRDGNQRGAQNKNHILVGDGATRPLCGKTLRGQNSAWKEFAANEEKLTIADVDCGHCLGLYNRIKKKRGK